MASWLSSMWDLSSPTMGRSHAPCSGSLTLGRQGAPCICFCARASDSSTVALWCRLKSWSVIPPAPFSSLETVLATQGLLCFYANFKMVCSSSVKNTISMLLGVALSLQLALGSIVILAPLRPERGVSFHWGRIVILAPLRPERGLSLRPCCLHAYALVSSVFCFFLSADSFPLACICPRFLKSPSFYPPLVVWTLRLPIYCPCDYVCLFNKSKF